MQFSAAAALAFVASVAAQIQTPDEPNAAFNPVTHPESREEVPEGSTYNIRWTVPEEFADNTVTIELIGGPEQNTQSYLRDVATGVPNSEGSYEWDVPTGLGGFQWYGLKFISEQDSANWQYSLGFVIVPDADAVSSSAVSTTTITTASGTATVTLSVPSTTSAASSSVEESSSAVQSSAVESSSAASTLTTTTTTGTPSGTPSGTDGPEESDPSTVDDDSAATHAKAGIFALAGGLAVALML